MRSLFFSQYLKHLRSVGSVTPSSRWLARKMTADVDLAHTKVIVEYGPGTGALTTEIIKQKPESAKLLLIEANEAFYRHLRKLYAAHPSVKVIHASAESIEEILQKYKLPAPDCIFSGLPFAALPNEVSRAILETTVKVLGSQGIFVTFQYTLVKKKFFAEFFRSITITHEPRNIPPAFVLRCDNGEPVQAH